MRLAFFLGLLCVGFCLDAQPWEGRRPPSEAEVEARATGKPIVLLWQAGPGAASFTQGVERLFTLWPEWGRRAVSLAVLTRGRSWEGSLPATYPPLPDPKASCLVVWQPGSTAPAAVWTEAPPVLELSRRLAQAAEQELPDAYQIDVVEYSWEGATLTRLGQGPLWEASEPKATWVEEGPVGTVLVLRQLSDGRRVAFPLEGDWSFLYNPTAQSWAPWNPVLVKRR